MKKENRFGIFAKCVAMCCVFAFHTLRATADNSIQVVPFVLPSSVGIGENCYFDVIINVDDPQQSFQFDMKIPEGMTIHRTDLSALTSGSFNYDYECIDKAKNVLRFICWSKRSDVILPALTGSVLRIYYSYTRPSWSEDTLIPFVFNNSIIGSPMFEEETEECSSSYFLFTNGQAAKTTDLNTKPLEGHLPDFVCDSIMSLLLQDTLAARRDRESLKTLMLPYVTSVAKPIVPVNKNAIVYCMPGSKALKSIMNERMNNVAELYYDEESQPVATIKKLMLYNEDLDYTRNYGLNFEVSIPLAADTVELSRTFITGQCASLYLPFAVDKDTFNELFMENGIDVYEIRGFDLSVPELKFQRAREIKANTPYFVKFTGERTNIPKMEDIQIDNTDNKNDMTVTSNDVSIVLRGSYSASRLSSTASTAYYAYDAASGEFKKAERNVHAYPFRSFIIASNHNSANALPASFYAVFDDDDSTDSIDTIAEDSHNNNTNDIYNLAGQKVSDSYKGIVIKNGRKEIRR